MAILDLGGNLLYLNSRGQQLMEIDDFSTYRYSPWLNFWLGAGQQAADSAIQQASAGGAGTFQAYCATPAGNPKWWDVLITPMRNTQGDIETHRQQIYRLHSTTCPTTGLKAYRGAP